MLVDKGDTKLCQECGEPMERVGDYGLAGEALECKSCGYYAEDIDLRSSPLSES